MTEQDEWTRGQTSLQFESGGGGPGTVSTGKYDRGGISYGTYQMASKVGVVKEYLSVSAYADSFKGMEINSDEFIAEWKRLAREEPGFGADQHDFIQKKHYEPSQRSLGRNGVDVHSRGKAFQDMVWSTSVQYGAGPTTSNLIARGLKEAYGDGYDINGLSDAQVVAAVQESKLRHVATDFRGSPKLIPGLEARIEAEKFALTHLADTGVPLASRDISAYHRSVQPLEIGMRGDAVREMQRNLGDLGYLSHAGGRLVPDGHFGPGTHEALKSFQRASGLMPHGTGSVLTLRELHAQVRDRDLGMDHLQALSAPMPMCRIDDPAHPDHGMFKATRILVHDLDRQHGREPDARSDNLAASLVVAARTHGLERIDQVALSSDASRLWGVERPPGVRDHFFDRQASTDTMQGLNTPIADSSNRWPEAMQAYETARMSEQQTQQQIRTQVQEQQQSQVQGGPAMTMTR